MKHEKYLNSRSLGNNNYLGKKELRIKKLPLLIGNDLVTQNDNTNMNYDKFTLNGRAS